MDESRCENRSRLSPRPAVEHPRDRRQQHILPVGKMHIRNVRKAEEDGSANQTGDFAVTRAREEVLQQPPEKKLFRPRRKKENSDRQRNERLPLTELGRISNEVHSNAQRNRDAREHYKRPDNVKSPAAAPSDVVANILN